MLRFIDISDWQNGIDLERVADPLGAVVVKATENDCFVSKCCDHWVQKLKKMGKPWGFYHFAGDENAKTEAEFFVSNCENYFGEGIPILDWEGEQTIDWVNEFVARVHELTNVWPWVYGNPWRFDQGQLNQNCAVWVAGYPEIISPSFEDAESWQCPAANGNVVAWQFCSDGRLNSYGGNLDLDLFYGDVEAWNAYAEGDRETAAPPQSQPPKDETVFENDEMKVTVEIKND